MRKTNIVRSISAALLVAVSLGGYVAYNVSTWRMNARIRTTKQFAASYQLAQKAYKKEFGSYSIRANDGFVGSFNTVFYGFFDVADLPPSTFDKLKLHDYPRIENEKYIVLIGMSGGPQQFLVRVDSESEPTEILFK